MISPDVFDGGPDTYRRAGGPLSPQELLIESLLQSLQLSSTREVEWWMWEEWKPVEAHRDCDEEAAAMRGEKRFPSHTLLLYVDVEPALRAPTCLWIPLSKTTTDKSICEPHTSALFVVPAVTARLLVYPGHVLHGAPRPALSWVHGASDPLYIPESIHERTVLVMNLWDDHAPVEEACSDEEDSADEEEQGDELDGDIITPQERVAPVVACEPREAWISVPFRNIYKTTNGNTNTTEDASSRTILRTFSHGSDNQLITPINLHKDTISNIFNSPQEPHWMLTESVVTDLGLGVPSMVGTRKKRVGC
jgi:hypothetical protein